MSPEVFNSMTPAEFIYAQYGYLNRRQQESRQAWEIARYCTYSQVVIHLSAKDRKSPEEMFPLPWDEKKKPKQRKKLTPEERAERVRKLTGK